MKLIIRILLSHNSDLDMEWKGHWSFWLISGMAKMVAICPFLSYLTSQQLSILSTLVPFCINSEDWYWVVSFSRDSQWQLGRRDSSLGSNCVGAAGIRLSPLLFNIYMKSLGEIIRCHELRHCHYANDTQLYISASGKLSDAVDIISKYLGTVRPWMGSNRLQLNPGKSSFNF